MALGFFLSDMSFQHYKASCNCSFFCILFSFYFVHRFLRSEKSVYFLVADIHSCSRADVS